MGDDIEKREEASEVIQEVKERMDDHGIDSTGDQEQDLSYWQGVAKEAEEAERPPVQITPFQQTENQDDDMEQGRTLEENAKQAAALNYWHKVAANEDTLGALQDDEANEAPEVEETPGAEETPEVEETPEAEVTSEAEEAPEADQTPSVEIVVTAANDESESEIRIEAQVVTTEEGETPEEIDEEEEKKVEEAEEELKEEAPVPEPEPEPIAVEVGEKTVAAVVEAIEGSEKNASNVEVLNKIANEVEDDDDKDTVFKMLAWAKSTKKKKTETFVIRAKKKESDIRKAIDFGSLAIVIDDKNAKKDKELKDSSAPKKFQGSRFEIKETSASTFQVRKASVIKPESETIVTKEWVSNAIKSYEQEKEVILEDMKFESMGGGMAYEAVIKAKVGPAVSKEYHWIIKEAPKRNVNYDPRDKDTYLVSDLGCKISKFVAGKRLKKRLTFPFQPVIMADNQFAIFDNIRDYKLYDSAEGFNLEHMKQALKALAKLHAMSYAYFHRGEEDISEFSEVLKMIVNKNYQPSASSEDKAEANEMLKKGFDNLISFVSSQGEDGAEVAEKARRKFEKSLYVIAKDANASNSKFSVLCHGNPTSKNIRFRYNEDKRPTDVKLTGFQQAQYGNAATDLQLLFCTSMSSKIEEQADFLLRFIYYEIMASTLKSLGVDPQVIEYETLLKEFKKKQVYGCLIGGMYLAGSNTIPAARTTTSTNGQMRITKRASGKRDFESKFVGRVNHPSGQVEQSTSSKAEPAALANTDVSSLPAMRAKALLMKALAF